MRRDETSFPFLGKAEECAGQGAGLGRGAQKGVSTGGTTVFKDGWTTGLHWNSGFETFFRAPGSPKMASTWLPVVCCLAVVPA